MSVLVEPDDEAGLDRLGGTMVASAFENFTTVAEPDEVDEDESNDDEEEEEADTG